MYDIYNYLLSCDRETPFTAYLDFCSLAPCSEGLGFSNTCESVQRNDRQLNRFCSRTSFA